MKRIIKPVIALALLISLLFAFSSTSVAVPAKSLCYHGLIRYGALTNMGNYSALFNEAVDIWNDGIDSYGSCCPNNVGLLSYGAPDITVSFTSYFDSDVFGRVSLWKAGSDGEGYNLHLDEGVIWEWGFMYVYPSNISNAISSSSVYDSSDLEDCILKSTVHELGHVLGLFHDDTTVMKPGLRANYSPSNSNYADLHSTWCN